MNKKDTILVIGACALDRLLHVPSYPNEDDKILCNATYEYGGGNASNTASGIGRLLNRKNKQQSKDDDTSREGNLKVQLLTKVADDNIMLQLCQELKEYSVDLSSELFVKGPRGSKSPIATVIVSNNAPPSRTCFFDKGTCGVLETSDVDKVDFTKLFEHVRHIHSDTRHTDAAAQLVKEARRRNISVSIDVERDRLSQSFDELLTLANLMFINEDSMKSLMKKSISTCHRDNNFTAEDIKIEDILQRSHFHLFIEIACFYYSIMEYNSWDCGKEPIEIVVTRGHLGAAHCKVTRRISTRSETGSPPEMHNRMEIRHNKKDAIVILEQSLIKIYKGKDGISIVSDEFIEYEIRSIGPPILQSRVVDTTGAGDAFAAGYIWSQIMLSNYDQSVTNFDKVIFQLRMASWVAGKKLAGPGSRATLPTSKEIDEELGFDIFGINKSLARKVSAGLL